MKVRFGEFTLDSATRQLARGGEPVPLSPKAFDVLAVLIEQRPNIVAKSALIDRVWPETAEVGDASLTVVVAEIRRALADTTHNSRYVRTAHRFGYAFCADAVVPGGEPAGRPKGAAHAWLAWKDLAPRLADGENVVGRDPSCNVWLDAPGVSRRHARIVVERATATIEDLGSTNGTFVDDEAVAGPRPLLDGQRIQFGPVEVRFRLYSPAVPTQKTGRSRRT